jgi:hypothetical protein
LQVEEEPRVSANPSNELRADFSVVLGTSKYYYNIQVVAINKDSTREQAAATLTEAADKKRRKYSCIGAFFHPLIFSAGGLIEKSTVQAYKSLQKLLGPVGSKWLDNQIAITLVQTRATLAVSIARTLPRNSQR